MVDYLQVEGNSSLAREISSHAIINRNSNAYNLAKKRATDAQRQRDEIRDATREINTLKSEIHEIKNLLIGLVGKQ
jgi:hypothetical protein